MKRLNAALFAGLFISGAAYAAEPADEVLEKMREYLTLWNAHDAPGIIATVYRMEDSPIGTVEGLQGNFDNLMSQGYDHSEEISLQPCMTGDDTALVRFKFTRFLTSGEVMGPRERTSHYELTQFEDGWRITSFASAQAVEDSGCSFS